MNINNYIYALLIGVGNYVELNIPNLPSYRMDLVLIATALINGLKCNQENIRIMAGEDSNGIVNADDFVREIGRFGKSLSEQDTFLFYFSGHGSAKTLAFSNLQLDQQSVIDYIDKIPCKNKIVFLDCCYSGNFRSLEAKHVDIEKSINEFVGHGIAVYASSSADELSRIAIEGNHSVFTGALATALISKNIVHKGKIELNDIYKETNRLVMAWNRKYPDKKQNPIYRSSIGGTIYFQVADYKEYVSPSYTLHNKIYDVVNTKPLNSSKEKRLCAFVVLHERATDELLIKITKEIANWLKDADVYTSKSSEEKFRNIPVSAIWCYFGNDERDIVNSCHQYYTIWAKPEVRKTYFRVNSNSRIVDDIYIFENSSYALVKKMQENTVPRAEYINRCKDFLKLFIDMAADFLIDLQEVENKLFSYEKLQIKYGNWIQMVKKEFISLSDLDVAPDDLHDWVEEILKMAGSVVDVSILLEGNRETKSITAREEWLISHATKQYYESVERLKELEQGISM